MTKSQVHDAEQELHQYLEAARADNDSKVALMACLNALNSFGQEVPERYKKTIEKDAKGYYEAEKGELAFEDVQQVIELFSDVGLGNVVQTMLQELNKDDFEKLRYDVRLTGTFHEDELAMIYVTDRWANYSESLTVWRDDDTFSPEYINEQKIGGTYINVYDTYEQDYEPINMEDYFGREVAKSLEKGIVHAYLNDSELDVQVNNPEFLAEYLPQHLVAQQLGSIDEKSQNGDLKKKDVLLLAKLLDRTNVTKFDDIEHLEQPMTDALKKSYLKPKEKKLLKDSFITLEYDTSFFKQFHQKNNEMVRG